MGFQKGNKFGRKFQKGNKYRFQKGNKIHLKHGCWCAPQDSDERAFYSCWHYFVNRIHGTTNRFKYYVHVTHDERWESFLEFKKDMWKDYVEARGRNPGKRITLDRIDWLGGYFKENCRWATIAEQNRNRHYWRGNLAASFAEIAERHGEEVAEKTRRAWARYFAKQERPQPGPLILG